MRIHPIRLAALLPILLLLSVQPISAQTNWWYQERGAAVTLEMQRPHYANQDYFEVDPEWLNMVGFVGGRIRVADDLMLLWEIPFVSLDAEEGSLATNFVDQYYIEKDRFTVGNPMFGLEQPLYGEYLFARASFRFPFADKEDYIANQMGIYSAFDRHEAFLPDCYALRVDVGLQTDQDHLPIDAKVLIGASTLFPDDQDQIQFAEYSAYLGAEFQRVMLGGFFGGRLLTSPYSRQFDERNITFCGGTMQLKIGPVEPGFQIRYNLDRFLKNHIDYTYGFNLAIPLQKGKMTAKED